MAFALAPSARMSLTRAGEECSCHPSPLASKGGGSWKSVRITLFRCIGITKVFDRFKALDAVDLNARKQTVHAILV